VNISVDWPAAAGTASSSLLKRFCVLKHARLDCYKDPLDDCIELSASVAGATLDLPATDKLAKRDLAVKISLQNGREILLEVSVRNWFVGTLQ